MCGWIEMPDSSPRFDPSEERMSSGRTVVPHEIFEDIAYYASGELTSAAVLETARYCLMDSLACGCCPTRPKTDAAI